MSNYLIDFIDTADSSDITNYLSANQCTVLKQYAVFDKVYLVSADSLPPTTPIVDRIVLDDQSTALQLLSAVNVEPLLAAGEFVLNPNETKDWWKAYSARYVDLDAQELTIPVFGKGINVYMVDSGIDIAHTDFEGKDIALLYSVTDNFNDTTGHGTALSSLVVGKNCGLTDASLKVVKIFEKDVPTLQSKLLEAFEAVIQDSLASQNLVSVVNLSWAIPKNEYIESKIRSLVATGVIVICAAGNAGLPIADVTPAGMPEVITIGSYGQDFLPSDFSNYTDPTFTSLTQSYTDYGTLDSWAPGEQIWAAQPGGTYGFIAGTSAAAAIYTAIVTYNQSRRLVDGNLGYGLRTATGEVQWDRILKADRKGLLVLDDPRYSSSPNRIATYKNGIAPNATTPVGMFKLVSKINEITAVEFFVESLTQSYEILSPLPEGVIIERNRFIYQPTVDSSPTSVESVEVQFKITNLDGTVIDNSIVFVKLGTQFNQDALPEDDPIRVLAAIDWCSSKGSWNCSGACSDIYLTCFTYTAKSCGCI